jgi:hypothetical protein
MSEGCIIQSPVSLKSVFGFPPLLFARFKGQSDAITVLVRRRGRLMTILVFVSLAFYGEQDNASKEQQCQYDNDNLI